MRVRPGIWRPATDDSKPSLVTPQEFRKILERGLGARSLSALLAPFHSTPSVDPSLFSESLSMAITDACYGAYMFLKLPRQDWRSIARENAREFQRKAARKRKDLEAVIDLLQVSSERLALLAEDVEAILRQAYNESFAFPRPKDLFLLDLLSCVAKEISPGSGKPDRDAMRRLSFRLHGNIHGCLDYQKPIHGIKVRNPKAMLAFNLELILKFASEGVIATSGPMPASRAPNRQITAALVGATFPAAKRAAVLSDRWVESAVRGILDYAPHVRVVPWPIRLDEPPLSV